MKYFVRFAENGAVIDMFYSIDHALDNIVFNEEFDKKDNSFVPYSYEIYDNEIECILLDRYTNFEFEYNKIDFV